MSDGPLVLNGRVAGRAQITGVERWAVEVIPRLLAMRPDRYRILDPPDGFDSRAGQAWEQFVLPAAAARMRAALVWSPANLAPWLWPRNVVVLHDAAVLRNASGYSPTYRAWHAGFGTACAKRAMTVVTVSEFSRRELVNLGGLDPEKVVVIPGGVDSRFHAEVDHERVRSRYALTRPYVLTVGTDDPRKNLGALGHTAHHLRDLGLDLIWAGGGKRHISNGTSVSGLRPLGYVAEADLPGLYAGARAFVLPSRYEGFGLPCVEAMACGTPVVAANRAALPETCGDAALLVDPDDPAEVSAAVIRAATDPEVRVRMRHAGFQRATEMSWEAAAVQTDTLLMQLAEQ